MSLDGPPIPQAPRVSGRLGATPSIRQGQHMGHITYGTAARCRAQDRKHLQTCSPHAASMSLSLTMSNSLAKVDRSRKSSGLTANQSRRGGNKLLLGAVASVNKSKFSFLCNIPCMRPVAPVHPLLCRRFAQQVEQTPWLAASRTFGQCYVFLIAFAVRHSLQCGRICGHQET